MSLASSGVETTLFHLGVPKKLPKPEPTEVPEAFSGRVGKRGVVGHRAERPPPKEALSRETEARLAQRWPPVQTFGGLQRTEDLHSCILPAWPGTISILHHKPLPTQVLAEAWRRQLTSPEAP